MVFLSVFDVSILLFFLIFAIVIFGGFFADLIACLSIILTNSFHDPPLVFNSAISFTSAPAVAL